MTKIFKTAKIHILLQPFFLVVGFVWNSFLTKNLSVSDFGLFSLSMTLFSILSIFANFGMSGGLMRYIPLYEEQNKKNALKNIYYFSMVLPLIIGSVFYVVVILLQDYIQSVFIENFSSIVYMFGLYIILNSFISSQMKIAITKGDFLYVKLTELFLHKLFPLVVLYMVSVYMKLDVFIVASIYLLGLFLSSIVFSKKIGFYYKQINLKRFKKTIDKDYFKYSFYISLTGLISMLYMWSDNIMIGYFLGNYDVGIYSAVFLVAVIVKNFWYMAFSPILLPVLSKYIANDEKQNVKFTFDILQKSLFLFTIPIFLIFLYFGSDMISILFTKEYLAGISSFKALTFLYLLTIFFGYSSYVISAYGDSKIIFKITIVTLVFNILLNLILIPEFKILGAAISTGLSELIYTLLTYFIGCKRYNLKIKSKAMYGLLMAICLIFVLHIFENNLEYITLGLFIVFYSLYTVKSIRELYSLYQGKDK